MKKQFPKFACFVFCAKLIECGINLNFGNDCAINGDLYWDEVAVPTDVRFNVFEGDRDYVGKLLGNWFERSPKTTPVYVYGYDILEESNKLITNAYLTQNHIDIIIMKRELIRVLTNSLPFRDFKPESKATYVFIILQTDPENCPDNADLVKMLELFWKTYSILKLLAIKPCSCDHTRLYRYDPFSYDERKKSWGMVRNESLDKFNELVKPKGNGNGFGGYPLKVSLFERVPTAVKNLPESMGHLSCDQVYSYGFAGLDGCVLANMVKILDFRVILVGPTDESNYGYKLHNGSFIGSLGDVVNKKADISANSRFMNIFDAENTEFTSPVNNDLVCFVVPKAEIIPKWKMIFHCFKLSTWIVLIGIIIANGVIWYFFHKIRFATDTNSPKNLIFSILDIFRVFLSNSIPNVPVLINRRLLIMSCMIFNVITVGIFQGSLFTSFTDVGYYADINTLEELYESKIKIATSLDLFQTDDNDIIKKLKTRTYFLAAKALKRAAYSRDVAAVERMEDARFFMETIYISKSGIPLLHIVPECPSTYFLAYIVPKGSPFLAKFNAVLTRFREAGLIKKWYYEIVDGLVMNFKINNITYESKYKEIDFYDVQTSFYLLIVGIFISSIAFIFEIYCY